MSIIDIGWWNMLISDIKKKIEQGLERYAMAVLGKSMESIPINTGDLRSAQDYEVIGTSIRFLENCGKFELNQ